eukprot:TRINITY_DN4415_c0_g1_i1.p1 TRINITY_DN4415_c0_g1~~TRINITY_DN4415_c0_g1_i1.p1  ORF type:complete len:492 (+),score=84.36 TRINITY_DN4415_c0_g1_i1:122-1597(+)
MLWHHVKSICTTVSIFLGLGEAQEKSIGDAKSGKCSGAKAGILQLAEASTMRLRLSMFPEAHHIHSCDWSNVYRGKIEDFSSCLSPRKFATPSCGDAMESESSQVATESVQVVLQEVDSNCCPLAGLVPASKPLPPTPQQVEACCNVEAKQETPLKQQRSSTNENDENKAPLSKLGSKTLSAPAQDKRGILTRSVLCENVAPSTQLSPTKKASGCTVPSSPMDKPMVPAQRVVSIAESIFADLKSVDEQEPEPEAATDEPTEFHFMQDLSTDERGFDPLCPWQCLQLSHRIVQIGRSQMDLDRVRQLSTLDNVKPMAEAQLQWLQPVQGRPRKNTNRRVHWNPEVEVHAEDNTDELDDYRKSPYVDHQPAAPFLREDFQLALTVPEQITAESIVDDFDIQACIYEARINALANGSHQLVSDDCADVSERFGPVFTETQEDVDAMRCDLEIIVSAFTFDSQHALRCSARLERLDAHLFSIPRRMARFVFVSQ